VTIFRSAAKVDSAQKSIVQALRNMGIEVWAIRQPCDLLLRFWCESHHGHCWQTMEVKTPYGKKSPRPRLDSRQKKQQDFLDRTYTPVVVSFEDAMRKLNTLHRTKRIDVSYVLKPIPTIDTWR
jgi:hypothetical protein